MGSLGDAGHGEIENHAAGHAITVQWNRRIIEISAPTVNMDGRDRRCNGRQDAQCHGG
jgi:hypothetical protein